MRAHEDEYDACKKGQRYTCTWSGATFESSKKWPCSGICLIGSKFWVWQGLARHHPKSWKSRHWGERQTKANSINCGWWGTTQSHTQDIWLPDHTYICSKALLLVSKNGHWPSTSISWSYLRIVLKVPGFTLSKDRCKTFTYAYGVNNTVRTHKHNAHK